MIDIKTLELPDQIERPTPITDKRVTMRVGDQAHLTDLIAFADKYGMRDKLGAALIQVLNLASAYCLSRREDILLQVNPDFGGQKEPMVTWTIGTTGTYGAPLYHGGIVLHQRERTFGVHS